VIGVTLIGKGEEAALAAERATIDLPLVPDRETETCLELIWCDRESIFFLKGGVRGQGSIHCQGGMSRKKSLKLLKRGKGAGNGGGDSVVFHAPYYSKLKFIC